MAQQLSSQRIAEQAYPETAVVAGDDANSSANDGKRLIRINGRALDAAGQPMSEVAGVTFAVYSDKSGGAPLWQETQTLTLDKDGRYSVLLGAGRGTGIPVELFSSGEARWLGVQIHTPGVEEQQRVLLVSVPYAMQSGNAETLGGLPASAFVLASSSAGSTDTSAALRTATTASSTRPMVSASGAGAGYLPVFTNVGGDLVNSTLFQSGSNIGIGTTSPQQMLDVKGGASLLGENLVIDHSWNPNPMFRGTTYSTVASFRTVDPGNTSISFHNPSGNQAAIVTDGPIMSLENGGYFAGSVGIGTANPLDILDIAGPATHFLANTWSFDLTAYGATGGWARAFRITNADNSANGKDGGAFGVLGSGKVPAYVYMAIPTADLNGYDSSKILVLNNSGNVGIGTTNPRSALQVTTAASANGALRIYNSAGGEASVGFYGASGDQWVAGAGGWGFTGAFTVGDITAGTPRLLIDSSGYVGIGTTAPDRPLTVNGAIHSTSGGFVFPDGSVMSTASTGGGSSLPGGGLQVDPNNSNSNTLASGALKFGSDGTVGILSAHAGAPATDQDGLDLFTGGNSRLTITASGQIGIGTQSPTHSLGFSGASAGSVGLEANPTGGAGNDLSVSAGAAASGASNQPGGNLVLAAGNGTGTGAGGNVQLRTAGDAVSGTAADAMSDRLLIAGKPKAMTGAVPAANLFSLHIPTGEAAGGRVKFTIVASDGVHYSMQTGEMAYLANPQQLICSVVISQLSKAPPTYTNTVLAVPAIGQTDSLNAQCNPVFFGNDQGVQIMDTAPTSFTPTTHKVYYTIENQSQASITLQP